MEYIYILRSYGKSASHIKVGYTSEIWDRMRAYKSCNPHIEVNSELTEEYILSIIPEAKLIVDTLGTEKIRTLRYVKKDLTSMVYSNSNEFKTAVKFAVQTKFQCGKIYPSAFVKKELKAIYQSLQTIKKANATDLYEYFEIYKKKRLINGKTTDSIEIIKQK